MAARCLAPLVLAGGCWLLPAGDAARGAPSMRAGAMAQGMSSSASATSQVATSATDSTSQIVSTSVLAQRAQASLSKSVQALNALKAAQAAAHNAAINSLIQNLGLNPNAPGTTLRDVANGLGGNAALGLNGGLVPAGGPLQQVGGANSQTVDLATGNSVSVGGKGGSVILANGTPGNDKVAVSGAGSITTSGGTVTATSGSLSTQSGATISTTVGGSITVTGGKSTLSFSSNTNLSSSLGGTVTLPGGQGTVTLPANTAVTIPAGSIVTFSGASAGAVSIAGAAAAQVVTLSGAGTLSLAGAGSITANSGTIGFSSGVSASLATGSTINLSGAGSVSLAGGSTGGNIAVIVPQINVVTQVPVAFTTTGTVLNTESFGVPANWKGVGGLSQSTNASTGAVVDTVTQSTQQALLFWSQFDIGKKTTLDFDQSAGGANVSQWVAINEITDPSLAPSQILGHIEAPGQVYVINQNGIIFGGSSQVNVGALTASSLALNPNYINNGLLNDSANSFQFQFSSLVAETPVNGRVRPAIPASVAPLFTAPTGSQTVVAVPAGNVTVQAGARLTSPATADGQGGRIALVAPNVVNQGTISTPDGQTILAAGLQVGFSAHNSNDPSLRGLDVFIGRVQSPAGSLPTGTFTFNGLPEDALNQSSGTFTLADETLTFAGSGQVGSFTPSGGKATPIMGGVPVTIPIGSTVVINAGVKTPGFAAIGTATPSTAGAAGTAGAVANAANAFNAQGAMTTPGGDVESSDGDITMAGSVVNQLGVLNGSTSVTLNGRIDLLADFNTAAGTINTSEPDGTIVTTQAFFPSASGTVTLGGQSVTQILPDASNATTIGTELANTSIVNVQGLDLEMQANALLLAPGAGDNLINPTGNPPVFDLVNKPITSGVTFNAGSWVTSGSSSMFTNTTGVINIGSNATIDVSGSEDVSASVLQDIVEAQLRGPQFADSPLQRNGGLRGDTVFIDIRNAGVFDGTPWIGSPIGDLSGFVNDVERTVGELTIGGGTVALTAGKSVSTGSGALINVSGGWINYTGATVQTTNVLANGEIINISQATPNLSFGGISSGFIATSPKWGVTQTFLNALTDGTQFDPGYIQGGGGGGINITAPSMSLQGGFFGQVVAGPYQRTPQMGTSSLASTFTSNGVAASFLPTELQIAGVPQTSSLDLAFMQNLNGIASTLQPATNLDIRFATDATIAASVPSANNVLLSEDIVNQDGFGDLTVNAAAGGTITVPAGVSLTGVAGGALSLTANDITIGGSISMPAGSMSFSVDDIPTSVPSPVASNGNQITPPPIAANGVFELAPGASLSAAGLVVDDRTGAPEPMELPDEVNGGSISIAALKVDLAVGSTINVSGGLDIASNKQQTFGIGGSLSILGGKDPGTPTLVQSGSLLLGSIMTGYSGSLGGGGSLTIQSPLVQVGGSMLLNGDNGEHSSLGMYTGETGVAGNGNTLWLDPGNGASGDFFSQGGFENFTIEGIGQQETLGGKLQFAANGNPDISPAVLIAPGMVVDPVVESFVSVLGANNGGLSAQTLAQTEALLPSQRSSVNLTFEALGINNAPPGDTPPLNASGAGFGNGGGLLMRGDVVLSAGAQIITGPQTNVNNGVSLLAPNGTVAVLGTVEAPGGTITISGGNTTSQSDNDLLFFGTGSNVNLPFATVLLASGSLLSTAGVTELTPNTLGLRTGNELNGGDITISGNIVAESGATIDVSGASDVLNETAAQEGTSGNTFRTMRPMDDPVASNAGTITLAGTQMLLSDATLLGRGGAVSTAAGQGGTLNVSVGSSAQTGNASVAPPVPQDVEIIVSQMGLGGGGFSIPPGSAGGIALLGTSLAIESTGIGATVNAGVGGAPVDGYFAVSPNLFVNGSVDASANDNGGWAGGFVNLVIPGTIDFIGNVNITAAQSIQLAESTGGGDSGTGGVIEAGGRVVVTAPYVALNSFTQSLKPDPIIAAGGSYPAATGGTGALMVNADVLADVGNLSLQDIDNLTFNANAAAAGDVRGIGTLQVAGTGTIQMNAAQVYPPTEQTFTIEAGTAIFGASGQPLPALPLSGGGTLDVDANVIMQDGVLRAPFGVINLGTSGTSAITLGAGSITSVSGVDPTTGQGIIVPYGLIDASGQWFDPMGNNITLTGPPVKAINITGNDIKLLPGSTLDERGGGELLAYQFNPGLGGNQDILASDASFAIIPGFTAKYAPDGTFNTLSSNLTTNNVTDDGYFNPNLAVGEQIFLNGGNGLPTGFYTLLPARYAVLPGAFLVTPDGAGVGSSVLQPDGSIVDSGFLSNGLNPARGQLFTGYQIITQGGVLNDAPYLLEAGNSFFTDNALSNDLVVPRLPEDAGQLLLDAADTLVIQGMLLSQAPDGLGGEVDIASSGTAGIFIDSAGTKDAAPSNALVLDSSQLTSFGAASLFIGGFRTSTTAGTTVTVTTPRIIVDNGGATTTLNGVAVNGLAAPDLILAATGTIDLMDNSSLGQLGQLPGGAQALTVAGNGSLLRMSSDSGARITRQGVSTPDGSSVLAIGSGVKITNAQGGGAVGALILDTTGSVTFDTRGGATLPVIAADALSVDSGLINIEVGNTAPASPPTSGLVIDGPLLQSLLSSTQSLSLLSYSSIDLFGSGNIGTVSGSGSSEQFQEANLTLDAADIVYADSAAAGAAGPIRINAQTVTLNNLVNGTLTPLTGPDAGGLVIHAKTINLGSGTMRMDEFTSVTLEADSSIQLTGLGTAPTNSASGANETANDVTPTAAGLAVGGDLIVQTPLITSGTPDQKASTVSTSTLSPTGSITTTAMIDEALSATGSVEIETPAAGAGDPATSGLGAVLAISGSSIDQQSGTRIVLHSGSVSETATSTAAGSNVTMNGTIDVSGVEETFFSLNKYTPGGEVALTSVGGNVAIGGGIDVSAASGLGVVDSGAADAGSVTVTAAGLFSAAPGSIVGQGGTVTQDGAVIAQGAGGTFTLVAGTLDGTGTGTATLGGVESALSGFDTQSIRDQLDSKVTVNSTISAPGGFSLTADAGSIVVGDSSGAGVIESIAPGPDNTSTGGSITLSAGGSVTVSSNGTLSVAASALNDAGQGGTVSLDAGTYEGKTVTSTSAAVNMNGDVLFGTVGGTLNLRAPQVAGGKYTGGTYTPVPVNATDGGDPTTNNGQDTNPADAPTDVAIGPINPASIQNATSINVEGVFVQDAKSANATIDSMKTQAQDNASAFMANGNGSTIESRIFGPAAQPNVNILPGEEIDNSGGNLELQSTWDLSQLRYTVNGVTEAGVLTLRAAGNIDLDLDASLTDGFDTSAGFSNLDPLLAAGNPSWSYTITAGADFSAGNTGAVETLAQLAKTSFSAQANPLLASDPSLPLNGSLEIGWQNTTRPAGLSQSGANNINSFYQTIRTGTGNITINAGGDVLLLNNLATIYTAGEQIANPGANGAFSPPSGLAPKSANSAATPLPATYSSGGGNVILAAQGDIAHETYAPNGKSLVADSSDEMPTNWLDREGSATTPTTWWVDFTNFFEGIGALGGGNVTLTAGNSVINVDAVAPTNAREIGGQFMELGGGDVTVRAGNNIDGGVYYVEHGQGTLVAGGNIETNATRETQPLNDAFAALDDLPTTLFLGGGASGANGATVFPSTFSVLAGGSLLLGPVANPFLLPQSINNTNPTTGGASEISYFSTYAPSNAVNVASIAGSVTLRDFADQEGQGSLFTWYTNLLNGSSTQTEISTAEPWLKLAESANATNPATIANDLGASSQTAAGVPTNDYGGVAAIMPPTLRATAFSGDLNIIGTLTLSPSALGTVDLVAEGSVNGFGVNQVTSIFGTPEVDFAGSSLVNLSDADPSSIPGVTDPFNAGSQLPSLSAIFQPTGATQGLTLQQRQEFHGTVNGGPLHAGDENPVYVFADNGSISGLTLFTPKLSQVIASEDITDVGLYLQNDQSSDISVVAAGRDILAYDANSPLRQSAFDPANGDLLVGMPAPPNDPSSAPLGVGAGAPNSGDIQIAGPGALEVLAGRNFTLGNDAGNPNKPLGADGLFTGLTSVGGEINPGLPFGGADLIAAAGLGTGIAANGLNDAASMNFPAFIADFLNPAAGSFASTYLADLAPSLGLDPGAGDQALFSAFQSQPVAQQDALALDIFYLVLRDAGRNHNNPGDPGFGNFNAGEQAIGALFPSSHRFAGNIDLSSREAKTSNGGDIDLLTPGGGVTVGVDLPNGQPVDQGVLTVDGGNINIFANNDVAVGTSRIFTLHGGNVIIWSTNGSIAAGASSKTVVSAPPTQVIVDPTSGAVETDLAGLATGGGIGVLESVVGAPPGDVDLIAPNGTVDAGDAGIRASGNINIAALKVLNADNISAGGKTTGVPTGPSINLGALAAASSAAGSSTAAAENAGPSRQNPQGTGAGQELPSIVTVEVLGFGGGDNDN